MLHTIGVQAIMLGYGGPLCSWLKVRFLREQLGQLEGAEESDSRLLQ